MKFYITVFFLIINLMFGCSKNNFNKSSNSSKTFDSLSLDAQQSNDVNNKVRSILKPKIDGNVNFDGKNYKLNQFKSIVDTITSGYSLERISSDSIKIIRNNKKINK